MKTLRACVALSAILGLVFLTGCGAYDNDHFRTEQARAIDLAEKACKASYQKNRIAVVEIKAKYAKVEELYSSQRDEAEDFWGDHASYSPASLPSLSEQLQRICYP